MKLKYAAILLGLVLCGAARADEILSGTLTGLPNETVTYNFDVTSIFVPNFGGYIQDTISGVATVTGTVSYVETFDPSNLYEFLPTNDQITLAEFAEFQPNSDPYAQPVLIAKYDFLGVGLNQVELVFTQGSDPQVVNQSALVSTPEPETWTLMGVATIAILFLLGLEIGRAPRYRKPKRSVPMVPVSHPQRKA